MKLFARQKTSAKNSKFSEFMRNGSAREHKRVFQKVIEESIAEQRKVIEQAERLRKQSTANGD